MSLRAAMKKQTALEPQNDDNIESVEKRLQEEKPMQVSQSYTGSTLAEQRGKRAKPSYSQLNVQIPKDLKLQFKSLTTLTEQDMSEVVEKLIQSWVDEQNE